MTSGDAGHAPTEVKNIILSYPYITKIMVDSHCEILWAENYGSDLGCHPTTNYSAGLYDVAKQSLINQKRLRSNMLRLWIKNSMTTNSKCKLRAFNYAFTLNAQDYGATMFFVIVKMVQPHTHSGCSYIKYKLENMKLSRFKHDIPKSNLQID